MQFNVHSTVSWLRAQPPLAMGSLAGKIAGDPTHKVNHPAKLQQDSRAVRPGDIFVAMPGGANDGRAFIANAIQQGAVAVLWDSNEFKWPTDQTTSQLGVSNLKQQAGEIAAQWYGQPSEQLHVFAYTGTSGKTSCSTWTSQLLSALGKPCAVIGTRGAGMGESLQPVGLTTPQALEMQWLLAEFQKQNAQAAAIEASSIGIEEGRLNGTRVRTALFTNCFMMAKVLPTVLRWPPSLTTTCSLRASSKQRSDREVQSTHVETSSKATGSWRHRKQIVHLRDRLAVINAVGKDSQRECLHPFNGFIPRLAVRHHAR